MARNAEKQNKNLSLPKGIRQKENGSYCIDFKQNGRRHTKTVKTLQEAISILAEITEFEDLKEKKDITVGRAISYCYRTQWKTFKNIAQLTMITKHISHYFGDKTLVSKINQENIAGFIDYLRERKRKDSSINIYLSKLGTIFNRVYDDELVTKKIKVKLLRVRSKDKNIISQEQETAIIEYFRNAGKFENADLTLLLLRTGLRISEALKLQREHIDTDQNIIYIYENKTDNPRGIPVGDDVMEMLHLRMSNDKLFPHTTTETYRNALNKVKQALELPDDITIHSLRHTCITRLAQQGANASIIMAWAGHKSIQTSQRYIHLGVNDVKAFAKNAGII